LEESRESFLGSIPKKRPWRLFGLGFHQAWVFLIVLNPGFFAGAAELPFNMNLVQVMLNVTLSVGLVFFMFGGRRLLSLKLVLFSFSGICALGTLLIVLAMMFHHSWSLLLIGIILTGLGSSVLILSWGQLWTELSTAQMGLHLIISYTFAYILCAFLCLLPLLPSAIIAALLPFASALSLHENRRILTESPASNEKDSRFANDKPKLFVKRFFCAIVIIAVAYGASRPLTLSSSAADKPLYSAISMALVFIVLFSVVLLFSKKEALVFRIYRVMFAAIIIGYLCFPFVPQEFHWIPGALVACGSKLLNQLVWLLYPEVSLRIKGTRLVLFGWASVSLHVFTIPGAFIGSFVLLGLELSQPLVLSIVCTVMVAALVFLMLFVFKEKDFHLLFPDKKSKAVVYKIDSADVYDEVKQHYSLSERELDVFKLLANGRTVPFVAAELFMSQSTVKTHIKHIYSKMDIHNRQELHNIIENFSVTKK